MWSQFILNAEGMAGWMISIGLICWGYRRKYQFDEVLSRNAKIARWSIVAVCFLIVTFPVGEVSHLWVRILRVIVGIACAALFCWPNLANRILNKQSELEINE